MLTMIRHNTVFIVHHIHAMHGPANPSSITPGPNPAKPKQMSSGNTAAIKSKVAKILEPDYILQVNLEIMGFFLQ